MATVYEQIATCTLKQCLQPWDLALIDTKYDPARCSTYNTVEDMDVLYERCIPSIAKAKCELKGFTLSDSCHQFSYEEP